MTWGNLLRLLNHSSLKIMIIIMNRNELLWALNFSKVSIRFWYIVNSLTSSSSHSPWSLWLNNSIALQFSFFKYICYIHHLYSLCLPQFFHCSPPCHFHCHHSPSPHYFIQSIFSVLTLCPEKLIYNSNVQPFHLMAYIN